MGVYLHNERILVQEIGETDTRVAVELDAKRTVKIFDTFEEALKFAKELSKELRILEEL